MEPEKISKEEILYLAEHAKYYTELLIRQCDSWEVTSQPSAWEMGCGVSFLLRLKSFVQRIKKP